MFAGLAAMMIALSAATAGGPQVNAISTRALVTTEGGGPRCISKFETDGRFSLPEHCKASLPALKDAARWTLDKSRLTLSSDDGREIMVFAADGRIWRAALSGGTSDLIIVFMTIEAEPQ